MFSVLGISGLYHDSAAALLLDGVPAAAVQEERFTRRKHDPAFPREAIRYCLSHAGLTARDLDAVAFYEKPFLKFGRLLETYVATAPAGFRSFLRFVPAWTRRKLFVRRLIRDALPGYRGAIAFPEHHESHAASAFFPSPFGSAAIITLDGVGEWATTTWGTGDAAAIDLAAEIRFPHSLGLLYTAFTSFAGFRVNSGEYKLMGLAPYGVPRYVDRILDNVVDLRPDGSFRLDLTFFDYCAGLRMTNGHFDRLFDGPARQAGQPIGQREMDLAASIQRVLQDAVLRIGRHVRVRTGRSALCMAGGVALNCAANGELLRQRVFDRVWIQPAAGDAGGALGAALFTHHQLAARPRRVFPHDGQRGSLLGPRYSDSEVRTVLQSVGACWNDYPDDDALCAAVSDLLADGQVVAWFQGRLEFGPRALGSRSILADPRLPDVQSVLNLKVKFRESFRPFAPSVLRSRVSDYFDVRKDADLPYMLVTAPVLERHRVRGASDGTVRGLDRVRLVRSVLPAVTHLDYSARIQTVDEPRHGRYAALLQAFWARTGCPVLINTSFNLRGEPICCTPADAWRCFVSTRIDALVLERAVVLRDRQGFASDPPAVPVFEAD